jgi:hypothetical protein
MTEVYRNDAARVHIPDGQRVDVGRDTADFIDVEMRSFSRASIDTPLCPGCYMVAVFNCAVQLAKQNGQSLKELGRSMACAFEALANGGESEIESIRVILDSEGDVCQLVSSGNG